MTARAEAEEVCPVCGSKSVIYDHARGEIVCAVCGTVIAENLIDPGPEWRSFGDGARKPAKARAGPPLGYASFLTTAIDNKDAKGVGLDLKQRLKAIKMTKTQAKIQALEGRLDRARRELERLKKTMGVPRPCVERALEIFRIAYERGAIARRPLVAAAAAALYAACRLSKTPRSANELARHAGTSRFKIMQAFKAIAAELKTPRPSAASYIRIAAGRLGLSANVVAKAIEIARGIRNVSPPVAAGIAIYLAADRPITIKRIANALGITDSGLRWRMRKIGIHSTYFAASRSPRAERERAILGPYMLSRGARGRDKFIINGALALELAYNLRELGILSAEEVERIERGAKWTVKLRREVLMELGAEFTRPKEAGEAAARRNENI